MVMTNSTYVPQEEKEAGMLAFAWVTRFPLFEEREEGGWTFSHNPFSDPLPEHKEKVLAGEAEGVISTQYDLVCNGHELGGGSIRSSDPAILRQVLSTIGHSDEEIEQDFGHMLEALSYGAPPTWGDRHRYRTATGNPFGRRESPRCGCVPHDLFREDLDYGRPQPTVTRPAR